MLSRIKELQIDVFAQSGSAVYEFQDSYSWYDEILCALEIRYLFSSPLKN